MKWSIIKLIFSREVRDQFRDRRTMFMILVFPMLLYPALGLGLVQMTQIFRAQSRTVGLVGADFLPKSPPLLNKEKTRFNMELWSNQKNYESLAVSANREWTRQDLISGKIDLLIVVPEETQADLEAGKQVPLEIYANTINDNSQHALRVVDVLLGRWVDQLVTERMQSIGKGSSFANPIRIEEGAVDVAPAEARSGTLWGRIVPFTLVMMALTGAFYPAIDMCAGEKERGTMETLLITPAHRSEIVIGKFLAIYLFSIITTMTNLASMGLTLTQVSRLAEMGSNGAAEFTPPTAMGVVWMFVLMLPLAGFFSALSMAIAVFAKSTREGQYYLMPMFLAVTPLTFLTLAPGVKLSPFYALVPVTNVALLLRSLLLHQYETSAIYSVPVLAPTLLYGWLALRAAVDQFKREEILFREAERFELRYWIRHLLRDKEPLPSAGMAWSCFLLILMLQWYLQNKLHSGLGAIVATQLLFIAFPAIMMALLLTSRPLQTLLLRVPVLLPSLLAILAAISLHQISMQFALFLHHLFPIPEEIAQQLEGMLDGVPLMTKLLCMALLPAICEELAFRGFIMQGLMRRHSPAAAIVISSMLFGVMHLITPQMINATLLGIILGIIATRTGSIIPGMCFHAIHNALAIARASDVEHAAPDFDVMTIASAISAACLIGFIASCPSVLPLAIAGPNEVTQAKDE